MVSPWIGASFLLSFFSSNALAASLNFNDAPDPDSVVSMATTASGKLMRVDHHEVMKATSEWTADCTHNKGGFKLKGHNRCLRGASSTCTGACDTVNSGVCDATEMRFFFHYDTNSNQTKFCVPSSGCTTEGCCQWTKCLEATSLTSGAEVKRKDCSSTNTLQRWKMSRGLPPNRDYRVIRVQGQDALCLKLGTSSPYTLALRGCYTDEAGWGKLFDMPFQPTTTTTTTASR